MLCTGRPYFCFTFNRLPQRLCLALFSHATAVPVCVCLTHHLPFYWFWNLLPFLFHFPTRCTIWLQVRTQIVFGGSFEFARSEHKAHGPGKIVPHTCSDLFKPVQTFSHMFTPVHNCSQLFTPVHTCSHLFTPQWLSMLFSQRQFLVEFSPGESCYFSILLPRPALSRGRLMCYRVEFASVCSPNRELSNSARLE